MDGRLQVLAFRRKALQMDHPDTAQIMWNLATTSVATAPTHAGVWHERDRVSSTLSLSCPRLMDYPSSNGVEMNGNGIVVSPLPSSYPHLMDYPGCDERGKHTWRPFVGNQRPCFALPPPAPPSTRYTEHFDRHTEALELLEGARAIQVRGFACGGMQRRVGVWTSRASTTLQIHTRNPPRCH